jgi:hypothetical protein
VRLTDSSEFAVVVVQSKQHKEKGYPMRLLTLKTGTRFRAPFLRKILAIAIAGLCFTRAANAAPPNDNFANAQLITGSLPRTVHGSNLNATVEPGEPNHSDYPGESSGQSIWYTWTPTFSGTVTLTTEGSGTDTAGDPRVDTQIGVYVGNNVGALTLIAKKDDSDGAFKYGWTRLVLNVHAGAPYKIAVAGWEQYQGRIQLNMYPGVYNPPQQGNRLSVVVTPAGAGMISLNPPQPTNGYAANTVVTVTATPIGTNKFSGWGGAAAGSSRTVTVTMNSAKTVTGIFNSNHRLFLQHNDGRVAAWLFQNSRLLGVSTLRNAARAPSGWRIVGNGDFDKNGSKDLVLQHTDNRVMLWLLNGLNLASSRVIRTASAGYRVSAVTDLNGDGSVDLLLQHSAGNVQVWFMNGATFVRFQSIRNAASGWRLCGAADMNWNAKADLIFQQTDGRAAAWYMNGTNYVSVGSLAGNQSPGSGWLVGAVVNLNNAGSADLILQHTDTRLTAWYLNGTTRGSTSALRGGQPVGSGWRLLAAE